MRFLAIICLTGTFSASFASSAFADAHQTFSDQLSSECSEEKTKPAWFYEGYEFVPQQWRRNLRERYYTLKRFETIVATGRCTCAERYPDPEQWRDEIEALVDKYRDNPSEHYAENRRLRRLTAPMNRQATQICRDS